MSERPRLYRTPRARAVAELPLEALLAHADGLARGWAIALMLARPADRIGEVSLEEIALAGPTVCARVLRAVQSDAELERLTVTSPPGDREASLSPAHLWTICGARDAIALVQAIEALRGVLWEAALDAIADPSVRLLEDLGDRLAYVCSMLLAAALDASPAPASSTDKQVHEERGGPDHHARAPREPAGVRAGEGRAMIVDEHAASERVDVWEEATGRREPAGAEIEIRDQRRVEEGPAAWVSSIGAQLERFDRDGRPFAVLLVEPVELDRLRRDEPEEELRRLAEGLEDTLRAELGGWSGSLTRERPCRCWLLAPGLDRAGAEHLAGRLLVAVRSRVLDPRGAPLAIAVGTAVCPEDGRQAAALAAHADVGLYAARSAAGRPAARVDESA
jgi:GGDEF domain-containing protein